MSIVPTVEFPKAPALPAPIAGDHEYENEVILKKPS
jgi:hypothetical protein